MRRSELAVLLLAIQTECLEQSLRITCLQNTGRGLPGLPVYFPDVTSSSCCIRVSLGYLEHSTAHAHLLLCCQHI